MIPYLFVYGTLRRGAGHRMARWLAVRATFAGEAITQGRLYRLGSFPGMQLSDSPQEIVRGELFHLADPEQTFAKLDDYEGELFERVQTEARLVTNGVASGEPIVSWTYVYRGQPQEQNRISSGDFLAPPQ